MKLTTEEENKLVEVLIARGYHTNFIDDASVAIRNLFGCSQDVAFGVLSDLQERNIIQSEPESYEGRLTEGEAIRSQRRRWVRVCNEDV